MIHRIIVFFTIINISLLLFSQSQAREDDKIIFIGGKNPPYGYINASGEAEGYDVDLVNEIMKKINQDYSIKISNWKDALKYASKHNNVVLMGMISSEDKSKEFIYSTPIAYISFSIVSLKKDQYKSLQSLRGKSIIAIKGRYEEKILNDNAQDLDIRPILVDNAQEGLEMVKHKIADAFIINSITAYYYNSEVFKNVYSINKINDFTSLKYCMASTYNNDAIIMKINSALAQMKADGSYYSIYDKWINSFENKPLLPLWLKYAIYIGSFIFLLTLTISIFLQKRIKKSTSRIKEQNEHINKINEQLSLIINNTNSGYIYLSPNLDIIWESVSRNKTFNFCNRYKEVGKKCYSKLEDREVCKLCPVRKSLFSGIIESAENNLDNIPIEQTAIPIVDEEGRAKGVILKIEDITQQKKNRDELIKAKEKAEQSDRLKSAFLANVTHEFRTPLNSIIGFSSLIADEDNKEERMKYMDIIETNTDVLLNLINDILDLSSIESGLVTINRLEFNINDLLTSISSEFENKLKKKGEIEFIVEKPYDILMLNLDFKRTKQIITNYLTNAIKYTEKGSITLGYETNDKEVIIYVKDTGCGIPEDKIGLLFKDFQKLNSFKQGIGLGLSICKTIALAMNGTVGVESKFGKGSTFWISFPKDIITNFEKLNSHNS